MKPAPLLATLALIAAAPLFPQKPVSFQPDSSPDVVDPPNRVARLNWMTGDVSFQPAGLEEWTTATLNYPLTTNDHLFTDKDSRVELHIGPNVIRLDANSNFGFLNLDDNIMQMSLTDGSLEIRLRTLAPDDTVEIDTPNGAITLLSAGDYRIDTDALRDATTVTVRSGAAELYYGSTRVPVEARYTAYFQTDQNPIIRSANLYDDFDSFTEDRENKVRFDAYTPNPPRYSRRISDLYPDEVTVPDLVAEGMTGAEDLAMYGTWQNVIGVGSSWLPPVDANWTPYSDGSWAYVQPWGWTWVDAAPWGFAPFHYGRWTHTAYGWAWVPGPKQKTQVAYAPALVTFIGGGPADNVSWFPLGPRDQWTPPWRPRPDNVMPSRISMTRQVPGAVLSMAPRDFISGALGRPINGLMPEGQIIGSSPLVMPIQESVLVKPSRTRPPAFNRMLIVRTAPPAPPITFVATIGLLALNQGRPVGPHQVDVTRRQLPGVVMPTVPVRMMGPLAPSRLTKPGPQKPQPASQSQGTRPVGMPPR